MSRYRKQVYKAYSFGTLLAVLLVSSVVVILGEMGPILSAATLNQ